MKLRIARHTSQLKQITYFYRQILGLEIIGSFIDHNGYDGVFLGLKEESWHLEFTQSIEPPQHLTDPDDLLVFYCKSQQELDDLISRLNNEKIVESIPKNPYWQSNGRCFIDPDGFRILVTMG